MRIIGQCPFCGKECDIHEIDQQGWVYCDGCAREYPKELIITDDTTQAELLDIESELKYYA